MRFNNQAFILGTVLIFLMSGNPAYSQSFKWQQTNGPPGNYLSDIAVGKTGELYAATRGGMYISKDEGKTWNRKGLFDVDMARINILADGELIVISNEGQIYLSHDRGSSWLSKGMVYYQHGLAIRPNGYIYYIRSFEINGSPAGLFLSKDHGISWKELEIEQLEPMDIEINSRGEIFLGTKQNEIFISTDHGESWERILPGLESKYSYLELDVTTSSDGMIYVTYKDTLISSANTGKDWSKKWINIPDTNFLHPIVDDEGNIYLIKEGWPRSTYISNDKGNTWSKINESIAGEYTRIFNIFSIKSAGVLISTSNGIFRVKESINSKIEISIPNSTIYSLATTSTGDLLASAASGFYRSIDSGETWDYIGESRSLSGDLAVSSDGTIFSERSYEGYSDLYYSKDKGISWENSRLNIGSWITGLVADRSGNIFASSIETVWRSNQEPFNWNRILPDNTRLTGSEWGINCIALTGDGTALYIGRQKGIEKRELAGRYFKVTSKGLEKEYVNVIIINEKGHIFAGTKRGIFRSVDEGVSWLRLDKGFENTDVFRTWTEGDPNVDVNMWLDYKGVYTFHIDKEDIIYAGTYKNGIYMSADNGDSWTEINEGIGKSTVYSITSDHKGFIYAGTEGAGVYRLKK